jgi:hypothetical protein
MSKLDQITTQGNFRAKVEAILGHMVAKRCPAVVNNALRTKDQQKAILKAGYSKTLKSNHLPGPDGLARAADIVHDRLAWNASKRFWLVLGACAMAHGCGWGGLFGLNRRQRENVVAAIQKARAAGWPEKHDAYQVSLGWDPAHVELPNNWPKSTQADLT